MSQESFNCPHCETSNWIEAEDEGLYTVECSNEDCAAELKVRVALCWDVWVEPSDA